MFAITISILSIDRLYLNNTIAEEGRYVNDNHRIIKLIREINFRGK